MVLAPLQFSGQSLAPNITGGIQRGQQIAQGANILEQQRMALGQQQRQEQERQQQAQAQQQAQQQAVSLAERGARGEQIETGPELARLFVTNPKLAEQVHEAAGIRTEFQKNDLAEFGLRLKTEPDQERQTQMIQQRVANLQAQGRDPKDTAALLNATPERRQQFASMAMMAALSPGERAKIASGQQKGLASAVTKVLDNGASIQALPSGEVHVRNPSGEIVTGEDRLAVLKQAQESQVRRQEAEADIAVSKAQRVASATQREKRVSDIKTELSERNRNAARESTRLNQALKVASTADQGLTGSIKLQLAKVLPNIDVSDEAVLDQALKQLAIDQLQAFKGPTTDFEFGVVENTVGKIGDARTANIARLNSLKRANWFNQREFDQFSRHTKSGGDPDSFKFNMGEPIETKKGVFSLQDLQDTAVDGHMSIEDVLKRLNK